MILLNKLLYTVKSFVALVLLYFKHRWCLWLKLRGDSKPKKIRGVISKFWDCFYNSARGRVGKRLFAGMSPWISFRNAIKDGPKILSSASAASVERARVPVPRCISSRAQTLGREKTACVHQVLRHTWGEQCGYFWNVKSYFWWWVLEWCSHFDMV